MGLGFSHGVETLSSRLSRNILLVAALIIATTAYYYVVQFYDPNKNFFSQIWLGIVQESYDFYSGSPGGFYIQIGELLEKETAREAGIKIRNRPTKGGFENATKVMNSSGAFGLLQEDTINDDDFIRKHIRYITPLYLEHMHILYRLEMLGDTPAVLSPDNDSLRAVLSTATVSTGPPGSGSKIYASYLINKCNIHFKSDMSLGLIEALEGLKSKKLDVAFTLAGAPLLEVKKLLEECRTQQGGWRQTDNQGCLPTVVSNGACLT